MGYGEDTLLQRDAQAQIKASDLQLDAYRQQRTADAQGADAYGAEELNRHKEKKEEARERIRAERLRLRFAGSIDDVYGEAEEETQVASERLVRANAGDRPVRGAPQEMSERQKKKRAKRREKNLNRAKKKYGNAATADTLPMARHVAEFNKRHAKEIEYKPRIADESAELERILLKPGAADLDKAFSRFVEFPGESDAFIANIKELMGKNRRMKMRLKWYDGLPAATREGFYPSRRALMDELRSAQKNLERMLRVSLAANGVDFGGGRVTEEAARQAKEHLIAEHEKYKESFKTARDAMVDATAKEKLKNPEFQEELEKKKNADKERTGIDFDAIPVAYVPRGEAKYEAYQKLREAIDNNPERYREHKEKIDKMTTALLDVWNGISRENLYLRAVKDVKKWDVHQREHQRFDAYMENRRKEQVAPLEERFALLRKGMHILLEGKDVGGPDAGWMHAQLESEFGILTDRRREQLRSHAEAVAKPVRIEKLGGNAEMIESYTDDALRIAEGIQADKRRRANARKDLFPTCADDDLLYILTHLVQGYEVNESGEPQTAEDAKQKEADEAFVRTLLSGDPDSIALYVNEMAEEVITQKKSGGDTDAVDTEELDTDYYNMDDVVDLTDTEQDAVDTDDVVNLTDTEQTADEAHMRRVAPGEAHADENDMPGRATLRRVVPGEAYADENDMLGRAYIHANAVRMHAFMDKVNALQVLMKKSPKSFDRLSPEDLARLKSAIDSWSGYGELLDIALRKEGLAFLSGDLVNQPKLMNAVWLDGRLRTADDRFKASFERNGLSMLF